MQWIKAVPLVVVSFSACACSSDAPSTSSTTPANGNNPATTSSDIVAVASAADSFKTLVAAVQAADLVTTLEGAGPFTVFAPTDDAFAALPAGTVDTLLKPENKSKLASVLTYHVVPGKVTAAEVVKLNEATTVEGAKVTIRVDMGQVKINDSTVIQPDVAASNGVIHVIDKVLLPPM